MELVRWSPVSRHCCATQRRSDFRAALTLLCIVPLLCTAATIDRCNDRSSSGDFECSYRPQVVDPWQFAIGGPVHGTAQNLTEERTKQEYSGYLVQNCPNCCNPGQLVNQSSWSEFGSSGWGPDWPIGYVSSLTYMVVTRENGGAGRCLPPQFFTTQIIARRTVRCDSGWSQNYDEPGPQVCWRPQRSTECNVGNPISMPSASKVFTEVDYRSPAPSGLAFIRDYRSDGFSYPPGNQDNLWAGLGAPWSHNFSGALYVTANSTWVMLGQAPVQYFDNATNPVSYPTTLRAKRVGQQVRLIQLDVNSYAFYTPDDNLTIFRQVTPGVALPVAKYARTGWGIAISEGSVTESMGRKLQFQSDLDGRLIALTDPAGSVIRYNYKPQLSKDYNGIEYRNLSEVVYQDQRSRRYLTPDWWAGSPSDTFKATRITGIIDELNVEYETISYDTRGRVLSTQLAGGVERYVVSGASITDALGATRNYISSSTPGGSYNAITGIFQPAGAGCAASGSLHTYDDLTGNLASKKDFRGQVTCYSYDSGGRNLEVTRVEGLTSTFQCAATTAANASLPAGSRKVSSQWHPLWRVTSAVVEPSRITASIYNGQPDPFNSNALASCAPATALLPDGNPIAVLCKRVEQATTDTDGHLGFNAPLQAGVPARVQTWTYNEFGQGLTATDALSNTSTYSYYADTAFTGADPWAIGHTRGDLRTATNAMGNVTRYDLYDKHGNLLQSTDPNGVVTRNAYDLRQRLLSTTVAGQTTAYTYDAAGQLLKVTAPDGSWLGYEYDPAHRLVAVKDNLGNRIDYTLDNAGNRIDEQSKDAAGLLHQRLQRSIDTLGRVQLYTGM